MAIDPVFIALRDVPEFQDAGGEASLDRRRSRAARRRCAPGPAVDFRTVRALKSLALHASLSTSSAIATTDRTRIASRGVPRLRASASAGGSTTTRCSGRCTTSTGPPTGGTGSRSCATATRRRSSTRASGWPTASSTTSTCSGWPTTQWRRARTRSAATSALFGDFPFMVSGHSADVWARQHEFRIDASVGVPPDAFSETGQDWGLPVYRWDRVRRDGYEWLRQRARRCSRALRRVPRRSPGRLLPHLRARARRPQLLHARRRAVADRAGRAHHAALQGAGRPHHRRGPRHRPRLRPRVADAAAHSRAEGAALGARLAQPRPAVPAIRRDYAAESVAISGTHDTETLAEWWDGAEPERTPPVRRDSGLARRRLRSRRALRSPAIRDALLRALFGAGSDFVIVPFQDLFGWRDRVNVPAVVNDENWTWRLPWPIDDLSVLPEARERAAFLRALARETGRCARRRLPTANVPTPKASSTEIGSIPPAPAGCQSATPMASGLTVGSRTRQTGS